MSSKKLFIFGISILATTFFFWIGFQIASAATVEFPNPLTVKNERELLANILKSLRNVVGVLAVLMIVVGGIMYMMSFGNDAAMKRSKSVITAAVIGFAIVLGASTFLQEIWNILGVGGDVASPGGSSLYDIATKALKLALSVAGVIGIIGIVIGAIMYLTSYGDDDQIKLGKKIVTASVIGLAICLAAVVIVQQVTNLIG